MIRGYCFNHDEHSSSKVKNFIFLYFFKNNIESYGKKQNSFSHWNGENAWHYLIIKYVESNSMFYKWGGNPRITLPFQREVADTDRQGFYSIAKAADKSRKRDQHRSNNRLTLHWLAKKWPLQSPNHDLHNFFSLYTQFFWCYLEE